MQTDRRGVQFRQLLEDFDDVPQGIHVTEWRHPVAAVEELRRGTVEHRQQCHRLSALFQQPGQFEGNRSAEGVAGQIVRALGLQLAQGLQVVLRQCFHACGYGC